MMSRAPRWPEPPADFKNNKPTQKTGGKERAASASLPPLSGGKQAASVSYGRRHSFNSRGGDSSPSGGSLKRGNPAYQATRQSSRPSRPAVRLCSSRSFSSLHASSFTAAPFIRSSRSLSRLDRKPTIVDSDAVPSSQVPTETKADSSGHGQLSSSEEHIRHNRDQCPGESGENMKASDPSLVSTAGCHPSCSKVKKQTREGVYTLCAMTSGMKRNWINAVLKNVRPSLTSEATSPLAEQKSQQPDSHSIEGPEEAEHSNSSLQEHKTSKCVKETHQWHPEREQSSADGSSASPVLSPSTSSAPSPISPQQQEEAGEAASCHLGVLADTQTGVTDSLLCTEGAKSDTSPATLSNNECLDEQSDTQRDVGEQDKTSIWSEVKQFITSWEGMDVWAKLPYEQNTEQLVKELEQTQKEMSRLHQLNRNLQDELQRHQKNNVSNPSGEQSLTLQLLQKMNHDLRFELEAQKRSNEEAKEAELRRRVDLLAQQAQLLVTGDATALAQAHLEQNHQRFVKLQVELERRVASLQSQLSVSEQQRMEAGIHLAQLQQELQSFHGLQQEVERLQKHLQEATTRLHTNEEAQAQKEACLQKHLKLLQASQDRERRILTTSLAQADQRSQELQERLEKAEQQVGDLNKTGTWAREIEKALQQLQEELACTVSAVQRLQEEREQLEQRCQELQNQLSEADGEVSRLQTLLKTDETHYYNLEHSYENVCEELQLALGKLQQQESETQDIREGYERLLDSKEQELSEVLLKMEVLGNGLEETEVKLNELLKVCTCASSQLMVKPSEPAQQNERLQEEDSDQLSNGSDVGEHAGILSHSTDSTYQDIVSAGDDPERFLSLIHILETKLFVTEKKLRDIMQRLKDNQVTCQDPHICSQLTQSRATAQHLSLLLHNQAKQNKRFAQETENCCRLLAGRFQVALNIVQACRERLQLAPIDIADFERQLATVFACLQQAEKDAEKQKQDSREASQGEDKILNEEALAAVESDVSGKSTPINTSDLEDDMESAEKCLMNELFLVEHMVSVLQSQHSIAHLSLAPREDKDCVAHRYKSVITQRIALITGQRRAECDNVDFNRAIGRVCAEAELIYAALKLQQQYESVTRVDNQEVEQQKTGPADINPPESPPYEEQVQADDNGSEGAAKEDNSGVKKVEADQDWLERLLLKLQRRAKSLRQLIQEISDDIAECGLDDNLENPPAPEVKWMLEEAKLIYLSNRLQTDLEQELQQSKVFRDKLQASCTESDITVKDEQKTFDQALCQLQEDNSTIREELERAEQKLISAEMGNQRLKEDMQKIEDLHEKRLEKLQTEFQEKMRELQQIHEEEMIKLHSFYSQSCVSQETPALCKTTSFIPDQTEMHTKTREASYEERFSAMEEVHRKLMADLQKQHEEEMAALLKKKDQQLQEETAATLTAIIAMRRAHKLELEKSRQLQHTKESTDIPQLQAEHESEIQLLLKELEVLSVQHTQTCLENSRLNQELQDGKQALMLCQQENQELKVKQRDADEMSQQHFLSNGKQSHVAPQMNQFYEMEVTLRAREAEMQFLSQEARSLKEELKIARMDKLYAQNKLQGFYSKSQDEHCQDVNNICDDFKFATWSPTRGASGQSLEDSVTNASSAAKLKKTEKSFLTRQIRGVRSKVKGVIF